MNLQLVLLVGYSVALVALGLWVGRLVRGAGDFFVAGRNLSPLLLFATMLAANIGAGSTVGAASLGYSEGLSAWWWNGSAGLGSLVLALWLGPRIWREATRRGHLTLGDFVESRYGPVVRGTTSALLWLGSPFILAAQLIGIASILHVVAGTPPWVGAVGGGTVMILYFVSGGLLASAWVNLVQLVVLLSGFAVAAPLALSAIGGVEGLRSAALPDGFFDPFGRSGSGITLLALLGPAFIVSPGLIQKVYGAVDERAVRLGVAANGVALMCFGFLPPLLGMVARVQHPELASVDLALPSVLADTLPPAIGGLALAAVFSAEVSSADAVLFMLSTSLSQDLYRRFVDPAAGDRQVLQVARAAAVIGGAAGVALAVVLPTVVAALKGFYSILTVVFFVPVVAGVYTSRVGAAEALSGIVAGACTMVAVHLFTGGQGLGGWRPDSVGLVVAGVAFAAVLAARRSVAR
jgi:SSS family solute:Na+ symporter